MVDLSVRLGDLQLDNPVIPASGTFGYGAEFAAYYDLDLLGSFAFKGTTLHPRFGNEQPRIAECPAGLLNAVGLQNPGVQHVKEYELPAIARIFHKPVIANISGFSVDEYVACCEHLAACDQIGLFEINISCPNVHGGGMSFGMSPEMAAAVTAAVKRVADKPVYMKLSPNAPDIVQIARACEEAGADGLSLINTLLGMRIDPMTRKPVLANGTGGLSGPCVFPLAVRMVRDVAKAVRIPVIGVGGISSARDVLEMMLAGASAVEVGSANLVDPLACKRIVEELPACCARYGITAIRDITGGVVL